MSEIDVWIDAVMAAQATLRKMTQPQKLMLADTVRSIGNPERFVLCGDRCQSKAGLPTLNVLKRIGLLEMTRFGPTTLTPLGVTVRNAILSHPASNPRQDEGTVV